MIRRVDVATRRVTTLAGRHNVGAASTPGPVIGQAGRGRDGVGTQALFLRPAGLAVSADGATLYVADETQSIRALGIATGNVTTVVGGAGPEHWGAGDKEGVGWGAQLYYPKGLVATADGTALYVVDGGNQMIRRVGLPSMRVTTVAGRPRVPGVGGSPPAPYLCWDPTAVSHDGVGTNACFNSPRGLAISADGSELYVADEADHTIRLVTLRPDASDRLHVVSSLAGKHYTSGHSDGSGSGVRLSYPAAVAAHPSGASLWVAETFNHDVRQIHLPLEEPAS